MIRFACSSHSRVCSEHRLEELPGSYRGRPCSREHIDKCHTIAYHRDRVVTSAQARRKWASELPWKRLTTGLAMR